MSFPAKTPDEIKLISFNFAGEAAVGAVLTNPAVTAALRSGPEAATDLDIGTPQVSGQVVAVLVGAGTDGAKYRLTCEVDASNGEHHRIDKDLPVKENAAVVQ